MMEWLGFARLGRNGWNAHSFVGSLDAALGEGFGDSIGVVWGGLRVVWGGASQMGSGHLMVYGFE
ncbi:hypothetical protein [Egbenema bharatensis]|uniref:hypothetical protein n=1 Tax=Egbenema bharatensis TaxID=3463334 RepID=UPI003A86A2BB